MFGEIEDLANAGPFNRQVHSIGPTLFYNFGSDDDEPRAVMMRAKPKLATTAAR
jgi:hypothetical protein